MISNQGENDIFLIYSPDPRSNFKTISVGGEGQDFAYDILIQSDGGVTVVGESFSKNKHFQNNKGKSDILVVRWH